MGGNHHTYLLLDGSFNWTSSATYALIGGRLLRGETTTKKKQDVEEAQHKDRIEDNRET